MWFVQRKNYFFFLQLFLLIVCSSFIGLVICQKIDEENRSSRSASLVRRETTEKDGSIIKIKVLHTNDLHSRFDEVTMRGSKCRDKDRRKNKCVGGVARIKHMVDRIKEQHKPDDNVVFLNAGDFFQVGLKLVQDDSYFLKCRTPRMCGIST